MDEYQKKVIKDILEAHGDSNELRHAVHFTGCEVYWLENSSGHVYYQWIFLTSGEVVERHSDDPHCWWVFDENGRDVDKELDGYFLDVCVLVAQDCGSHM